jgi:RimJ/RimL family protein N-acetyltransferase
MPPKRAANSAVGVSVPRLEGSLVRLELLSRDHCASLLDVVKEDVDLYQWTPVPRAAREMERYIETAREGYAQGHMLPFAIVQIADARVVGTTRYYSIERWSWPAGHPEHGRETPDVCEIGYTWLARSAVRTGVNTQAKHLLLRHAFEGWRVHRLSLRTDVRNARSRAAIERIGARLDGIVRAERPAADGGLRDTAIYSIVASEWPEVSARLRELDGRASNTKALGSTSFP